MAGCRSTNYSSPRWLAGVKACGLQLQTSPEQIAEQICGKNVASYRPVDQNAYLISTDPLETSAAEARTLFPISFSCSVAASYCVFRKSA